MRHSSKPASTSRRQPEAAVLQRPAKDVWFLSAFKLIGVQDGGLCHGGGETDGLALHLLGGIPDVPFDMYLQMEKRYEYLLQPLFSRNL
jgi:hypothetical protein